MPALLLAGCAKDEPPPPLPEPQATATAPLALVPDEPPPAASEEAKPAMAGAGKKADAMSLDKCCAALLQNSQSAPEPTKTYMQQAAAQCQALAAAGGGKDGALAILQGALKGSKLPTGCK